MVVGTGEEEVAVALGHGAGEQRDDGGVCKVEGGEDGECVRRVSLDAGEEVGRAVVTQAQGGGAWSRVGCEVVVLELDGGVVDGRGVDLGQAAQAALVVCHGRQVGCRVGHIANARWVVGTA